MFVGDVLGVLCSFGIVFFVLCFLGEVFVVDMLVDVFLFVEKGFFVGVWVVFDELYDVDF